jgi:hypothetical protein
LVVVAAELRSDKPFLACQGGAISPFVPPSNPQRAELQAKSGAHRPGGAQGGAFALFVPICDERFNRASLDRSSDR